MTDKVPKGWKRVKLGEVIIYINRGFMPKYVDNDGYIIINQRCIRDGKIDYSFSKFTSKKKQIHPDKILRDGDILINSTGVGTAGRVAFFYKHPNTNIITVDTHVSILRLNADMLEPSFVFYNLRLREKEIESIAEGSTGQIELSKNRLKDFYIPLPPLPEQKAIASVLSSLDDKIDLLHRRNQTLEKMAETLFRQWFIEEAREDWEEVSLGNSELSKIIKSGIKKFDGIKIYLATGDVNDTEIQGGEYITYDKRPSRANIQPVNFSVWFAKKGGVRKLLMFDDYSDIDNFILSTGFTGLKTTELSHYYIWCFVLSKEFQEIKDSLVSGTVQPDINNDGVKQIMMLKPDNKTLIKFNEIVKPYFMKIQSNKNQIRTLEKLRDTLLPKLMSGEVRVKM